MRRSRGGRELGQVSRGQWCTHEAMCRDARAALGWSLRKFAGVDVSHGSMSGFKQGAKLKDRTVDDPASPLE
jgi:hypothetical protein